MILVLFCFDQLQWSKVLDLFIFSLFLWITQYWDILRTMWNFYNENILSKGPIKDIRKVS